ncbi:Protein dopey-1 [Astathelohania contejeani]|uniref:Protein dopey-1 n=1 Tax=Astathelohania contejeani TaxID=164912 RepID=A0ABQ7I1Y9_9MICR|nr:Protein dopey-1 [Thelohania contejeani]
MDKNSQRIRKRLDAFKNAKEWSDFIQFLTALGDALKKCPPGKIPEKILLFKRLNQCLNPALPAGVHTKVFQTYEIVFELAGEEELVENFPLLTLGLFSFSIHSRMIVKSAYLEIMSRFIIPLGLRIEPYTRQILLGLLPSLEEENNEFFNPTFQLLKRFEEKVLSFDCTLYEVFLVTPSLRVPIINYLLKSDKTIDYTKNEILIVKALIAGLSDKEVFVTRGTLDVMKQLFPDINKFGYDSQIKLVIEALRLLLRRDITINKRVYVWLNLGSSISTAPIDLLIKALYEIENLTEVFKILIVLMDKEELCEKILDVLGISCLIRLYEGTALKQANIFFEMVDLDYIWRIIYLEGKRLVSKNTDIKYHTSDPNLLLRVIMFGLDNLKIIDSRVKNIHLPFFCSFVIRNHLCFEYTNFINFVHKCINIMEIKRELKKENSFFELIDRFYQDMTVKCDLTVFVGGALMDGIENLLTTNEVYFKESNNVYEAFLNKTGFKINDMVKYVSLVVTNNAYNEGLGVISQIEDEDKKKCNTRLIFSNLWNNFICETNLDNYNLILNYNKIFDRTFEEYVLLKERKEVIIFMKYLFANSKIKKGSTKYFYNTLIAINNYSEEEISDFFDSLYEFESIIEFLFSILKNSNLESKDDVYCDAPRISGVKSVLVTFINLLNYSSNFISFLKKDIHVREYKEEIFIFGNTGTIDYKRILFSILLYIGIIEDSSEFLSQCSQSISLLITKNVITDISFFNLHKVVQFLKKDPIRNTPLIRLLCVISPEISFDFFTAVIKWGWCDKPCYNHYNHFLSLILNIKPDKIYNLRNRLVIFILSHLEVNHQGIIILYNIIKNVLKNKDIYSYKIIIRLTFELLMIDSLKHPLSIKISELLFSVEKDCFINTLINYYNSNGINNCFYDFPFKNDLYLTLLLQSQFLLLLDWNIKANLEGVLLQGVYGRRNYDNYYGIIWSFNNFDQLADELKYKIADWSVILLQKMVDTILKRKGSYVDQWSKITMGEEEINVIMKCINEKLVFNAGVLGVVMYVLKSGKRESALYKTSLESLFIMVNNKSKIPFMEIFMEEEFFIDSNLLIKKAITEKVTQTENILEDLQVRLESRFFVSRETDILNKRMVLARIAFILFSNSHGAYTGALPKLIEIISLEIGNENIKIRKDVLFLCRVVLMRINHAKLGNLWPILIAEVLEEYKGEMVWECLMVLEWIFVVNDSSTLEIRWLFLERINEISNIGDIIPDNRKGLLKDLIKEPTSNMNIPIPKKRIPFLNENMNISEYCKYASLYYYYLDLYTNEVDYEKLDEIILKEFSMIEH